MARSIIIGGALILAAAGCGDDAAPREDGSTSGPSLPGSTSSGAASSGETGAASTTSSGGEASGDTGSTSAPTDETTTSGGDGSSSSSTGASATCPETSECFFLDGAFHTATRKMPTFEMDLLFEGDVFSAMELEMDVTLGPWHPVEPDGLHNLFWLHRGPGGVGPWMGGVLGYVNLRGPNRNLIRSRHDLDVTDLADSRTFNVNSVAPSEGDVLHLFYRYDPIAGEVLVELTDQDGASWGGTDVPTTDLIRNDIQNTFYFYAGNETDISLAGPEVPTLGWTYANLRIEFME